MKVTSRLYSESNIRSKAGWTWLKSRTWSNLPMWKLLNTNEQPGNEYSRKGSVLADSTPGAGAAGSKLSTYLEFFARIRAGRRTRAVRCVVRRHGLRGCAVGHGLRGCAVGQGLRRSLRCAVIGLLIAWADMDARSVEPGPKMHSVHRQTQTCGH